MKVALSSIPPTKWKIYSGSSNQSPLMEMSLNLNRGILAINSQFPFIIIISTIDKLFYFPQI